MTCWMARCYFYAIGRMYKAGVYNVFVTRNSLTRGIRIYSKIPQYEIEPGISLLQSTFLDHSVIVPLPVYYNSLRIALHVLLVSNRIVETVF